MLFRISRLSRWWLLAVFALFSISPLWADDEAEAIISKLQSKYDSIRDASVAFTETVQFGVTQSLQTFTGRFIMKKGNKYRIELEQETIVTDGKTVWSYSKINNQVLIDRFKENSKSFSPDKVLINVPENYVATLLGKEKVQARELLDVKLVPKDTKSNIKWIKVWIDEDEQLMRKIQCLDVSDNLTTYLINDIKLNLSLKDDQFQFQAPDNVEVIDLR